LEFFKNSLSLLEFRADVFKEKKFDIRIDLAITIIKTLKELREKGRSHGDIHEGNILIDENNVIKIIDPGFSSFVERSTDVDMDLIKPIIRNFFSDDELRNKDFEVIFKADKLEQILDILNQYIKTEIEEYKLKEIKNGFYEWKDKLYVRDVSPKIFVHDGELIIRDNQIVSEYIYVCIFPSNYPNDLTDNSLGMIHNSLAEYFREFHLLDNQKVQLTPEFLRIFNDIGEEIKIFPDGKIFLRIKYASLEKIQDYYSDYDNDDIRKRYIFRIDPLFETELKPLNSRPGLKRKYGVPIEKFYRGNLEQYLLIICFIYNKNCKIQFCKFPIENFIALFYFPLIRVVDKGRILYKGQRFLGIPREYVGEKADIEEIFEFKFDEIKELCEKLKIKAEAYFQFII